MKTEDFRRAVRERLLVVPFSERRGWLPTDLLEWWGRVSVETPYLRQDGYGEDHWQLVHTYCSDMIGPGATS